MPTVVNTCQIQMTALQSIVQDRKMSSTHSGPRTLFYPSNPSFSQERVNPNPFFKKKKFGLYWFGGLYWTRTSDPIDVNDVLYQLSQQTISISNDDHPITKGIITDKDLLVNPSFLEKSAVGENISIYGRG